MLMFRLIELWKKHVTPPPDRMRPAAKLDYRIFEITDPQLVSRLTHWMERDRESRETIETFLDCLIPRYRRAEQLFYNRDIDGRLERISFCGEVPEGWGQDSPDSTLLKPVSPEAKHAVNALPGASREELHDLVDWPTIQPEWLPQAERQFARQANRLLQPFAQDGKVYLRAPHPDNFTETSPVIRTTFYDWRLPDTIRKADPALKL